MSFVSLQLLTYGWPVPCVNTWVEFNEIDNNDKLICPLLMLKHS